MKNERNMYKRWVVKALIEYICLSTPKKQEYIKKTKKGDPNQAWDPW